MGETTIAWCNFTFNPWLGCTKVSAGCANCYAEAYDQRWAGGIHWGKGAPRRRTAESNWRQPLKWDRLSALERIEFETELNRNARGEPPKIDFRTRTTFPKRPRVFCASLADWLDDEVLIAWLTDLLELIHKTPSLDWLLLTKRPQNFESRMAAALEQLSKRDRWIASIPAGWLANHPNVWIGTTAEDQSNWEKRRKDFFAIPARVHFVSVEPMLGPVKLFPDCFTAKNPKHLWIICGGESGPKFRPMDPAWARALRDECAELKIPFFMKQLGGVKGGHHMPSFPQDLQIRQFPTP